jgi:hypothetical protein
MKLLDNCKNGDVLKTKNAFRGYNYFVYLEINYSLAIGFLDENKEVLFGSPQSVLDRKNSKYIEFTPLLAIDEIDLGFFFRECFPEKTGENIEKECIEACNKINNITPRRPV